MPIVSRPTLKPNPSSAWVTALSLVRSCAKAGSAAAQQKSDSVAVSARTIVSPRVRDVVLLHYDWNDSLASGFGINRRQHGMSGPARDISNLLPLRNGAVGLRRYRRF